MSLLRRLLKSWKLSRAINMWLLRSQSRNGKPSWLLRGFIGRFRRVEFVVADATREVFVVAPFDCLVIVAAPKQQHSNREVDLRHTWQPYALHHTRLFHHN